MSLMSWDPFTTLARIDDEFDNLVRATFGSATYQFLPPVEMATEGPDVVLTLELPGVSPDDIDIEVADGRLTISGERRDRGEDPQGKVLVQELRYGAFRRSFQLPEGVTAEQIEASADHGLLRVRIKEITKPAAPPRKIAVKGADRAPALEGKAS